MIVNLRRQRWAHRIDPRAVWDDMSGSTADTQRRRTSFARRLIAALGVTAVGVDELDEWQSPECERAHGPGAP